MTKSERRPMVFSRVDHETLRSVQGIADERFGGNQSLVVREAIGLYTEMREAFGSRFDVEVSEIRKRATAVVEEQVAA